MDRRAAEGVFSALSKQSDELSVQVNLDRAAFDELMALGRGAPLADAKSLLVHELVARFAKSKPTATAVVSGGRRISYAELDVWAGHIAARLVATGIKKGNHVGLLTDPSTAMVAAVLGILKSGAAYVPVDTAQPDERIANTLSDADASAVLATHGALARLDGIGGVPLLRLEDEFVESGVTPSHVPVSGEDAAYLIYTSGSTGEPKGVLVEHGQLAASTLARRSVYPGIPVFLLVSPLAFDSSAAGLWGTLTAGGRLVVATAEEVRDPEGLIELVNRHEVTTLLCVSSLYSVLLDAIERLADQGPKTLRTVIVAGESLPESVAKRHFDLYTDSVALVNEYGPTEATVWASYQHCRSGEPVSIGRPVPGVNLYVLDRAGELVARGDEGELFIGGVGVSRGYYGRPEATDRAFVADPFAESEGARMYRTGDLVRWNDHGTLDFLGRRDQQVKIRGNRVEIGAVEAVLRTVLGVRDAVVVPNSEQTYLIGFVLASPGTSPELVRQKLAERLPSAMVPNKIQVIENFPLTTRGKIDRRRLSIVADEQLSTAGTDAAARPSSGGMVKRVASAWAEVLKVPHVPTEVNFFDAGGTSLAMFRLQDALERHTGIRPSVVALFRHTTVLSQVAMIRDGAANPAQPIPSGQAAARGVHALRARRSRARETASK